MTPEQEALALTIECPQCGRAPADACRNSRGYKTSYPHWRRFFKAAEQEEVLGKGVEHMEMTELNAAAVESAAQAEYTSEGTSVANQKPWPDLHEQTKEIWRQRVRRGINNYKLAGGQ
jgi:hypothetical protein